MRDISEPPYKQGEQCIFLAGRWSQLVLTGSAVYKTEMTNCKKRESNFVSHHCCLGGSKRCKKEHWSSPHHITLVAPWKHLGSTLKAPWKHLGSTLKAPWKHFGSTLEALSGRKQWVLLDLRRSIDLVVSPPYQLHDSARELRPSHVSHIHITHYTHVLVNKTF